LAERHTVDRRWWTAEEDDLASAVCGVALFLADKLEKRHRDFLTYARLYGNTEIAGLGITSYAVANKGERLTMNVVAACIDTATAKVAKNKPAPQFLTSGADYETRRKAEKLNKFGRGVLHQSKMYRIAPAIFRDACIFGTGFVKNHASGKRVCAERVFPWEILVDDSEAMYGEPRTLIQRKYIDRQVLIGMFPKHADAILAADTESQKDAIGRDRLADQVEVFEAWHLPSGKGSGDGLHVIAFSGGDKGRDGLLLSKKWKRESFPITRYTLEDPVAGFWGTGMAQRLVGIQLEINRLLQKIQRAFHLLGVPRVIMSSAAGIPKTHINNEIGAIITVNGGMEHAPTVVAPQTIHPEVFAHLEKLERRAYDEVGISQLSAHGEKPQGVNSGIAIREVSDIESDRFVIASRRFEELHIDVVRRALDDVREIHDFSVDVPSRKEKIEIRWQDVSLDDSAFVLQCFPAALLPQTPAGRFERVQELFGAGFIDQDTAMELLDVPDLEEAAGTRLASVRAIRQRVDAMLDGQEYVPPEAFDNLQLIVSLVPRLYLQEREFSCPENRLENIRRYIEEASHLMAQAAAAAQMQQMPAGAAPPADPTAAAVQSAPELTPSLAA
jgi:hypothetical protein